MYQLEELNQELEELPVLDLEELDITAPEIPISLDVL
jgi:hypothetical protein